MRVTKGVLLFLLIAFSPIVIAQESIQSTTPELHCPALIQFLCNTVSNLQTTVNTLIDTVADLSAAFTQYQLDTDAHLAILDSTDTQLQNQVSILEAGAISRSRMYEVSGTDPQQIELYCLDENDLLIDHYCAGGYLGDSNVTLGLLFDNFSDGEYHTNPTWTVSSGTWSVLNEKLVGGTTTSSFIYTPVRMIPGRDYQISFQMKQVTPNVMGSFKWFAVGDGRNANGYDLSFHENGNIYLYKYEGGNPTILGLVGQYANDTEYYMGISHHPNNIIEIFKDGSKIFQTFDDTYNSGSLVAFWTGNSNGNYSFDNVLVTYSGAPNTTGGFLNMNNASEPMGIKCNFGWEARIICYNPD